MPLASRSVAVYRGADGRVHALEARCPHLGADLAQGRVIGNDLRCPFHHWTFDGNGRCVAIPCTASIPSFARTFSYPTAEKYGAIWFFNGPTPLFPLPSFDGFAEEDLVTLSLRPRVLGCHPHIVAMNGLDVQHFKSVHRLDFAEEPRLEAPDPFRVRLRLKIALDRRDALAKLLRPLAGDRLEVAFTTWGGNLATIESRLGPLPLLVLFSHRPLPGNRSASRTFLFLPRQRGWRRRLGAERFLSLFARAVMGYILVDRKMIDGLDLQPNLISADRALAAFIRQVERMPVFDSGERCLPAG